MNVNVNTEFSPGDFALIKGLDSHTFSIHSVIIEVCTGGTQIWYIGRVISLHGTSADNQRYTGFELERIEE